MLTTIYQAFYGRGELIGVALSEDVAWAMIKRSYWYGEFPDGDFNVSSFDFPLQEVEGKSVSRLQEGKAAEQMLWMCPRCKKEHCFDPQPYEPNFAVCFCESGTTADMFLVKW